MMKIRYLSIFSIYFVISFCAVLLLRVIFFDTTILGDEVYENKYSDNQDFITLDLDSGKHVPFLRLHRDAETVPEKSGDTIIDEETINTHDSSSRTDINEVHKISPETSDIGDDVVDVHVFPQDFYPEIKNGYLLQAINVFTQLPFIYDAISNLRIHIFADDADTRGRMFRKNIYLYSLGRISQEEAFSVFIHEFGHYYDIHTLIPTRFGNLSERFYELSWQDVDVLHPGLSVQDFVSGYAMTNMYEDFAESYTYYILHNASFREKKQQSPILRQKYNFFEQYAFPKKQFYNRRFSIDDTVLPYYWDITKIEIDIEKFLQYLNLYL